MWLSGSGARQRGMTPRFRVTTLFFICFRPRKEKAAPDGWRGVAGGREGASHRGAAVSEVQGPLLGALSHKPDRATLVPSRELILIALDFVHCLFLS